MARPSRSMADQAASETGRVTRGVSRSRVTVIEWSNFTSTGETLPLTGAAAAGSVVAATGRWPSPANMPEVGSRPTHPAPGR